MLVRAVELWCFPVFLLPANGIFSSLRSETVLCSASLPDTPTSTDIWREREEPRALVPAKMHLLTVLFGVGGPVFCVCPGGCQWKTYPDLRPQDQPREDRHPGHLWQSDHSLRGFQLQLGQCPSTGGGGGSLVMFS